MIESQAMTIYSPQLGARLCEIVAEGETIQTACKLLNIPRTDITRWMNYHPDFERSLAKAKFLSADALADQLLDIAEEIPDVHRARLKSENLKWYVSKLAPARYGERLDLNVTQQVDVGAALMAARARLVRPISDQLEEPETQALEYKEETDTQPSDKESLTRDELLG